MPKFNFKRWMVRDQDVHDNGIIGWLCATEKLGLDMAKGIRVCLTEQIPELFREVVDWLLGVGLYAARIGVRFMRASLVVAAWLILVFGPLILFPGSVAAIWAALLSGISGWGFYRVRQKDRFPGELCDVCGPGSERIGVTNHERA